MNNIPVKLIKINTQTRVRLSHPSVNGTGMGAEISMLSKYLDSVLSSIQIFENQIQEIGAKSISGKISS